MLERFASKHIWIICDAFLTRSPLIEKLRNALPADGRVNIFNDITPDPIVGTVVRGIAQVQSLRPNTAMGSGGGSVLDATKAIVWFSQRFGTNIKTYIVIPIASDTDSEVISACVTNDLDKGIKYPLFSNVLYPDMAILDSALVVSVPPTITTNTGMDMLTHALEAYVFTKISGFTGALTEKAAQIVFQCLPVTVSEGDCLAARGKVYNASTLAGMTLSQAGPGINHATAHQLGGQLHLPYGLANVLLLTHVTRLSTHDPRTTKRYARLAKAYHLHPDNASDTAALSVFIHHIELLKE